jgi:hypothetical protein
MIVNKTLKEAANKIFNPRNAMHISRNDGLLEHFFNHKKDILTLTNTLLSMTNDKYTDEDLQLFEMCKSWEETEVPTL